MFFRIAPLVVGLVAVHVWLRRREARRSALSTAPEVPRIAPASAPEAPKAAPAAGADAPGSTRARRFGREPVDIVTVVDDLLLAGR